MKSQEVVGLDSMPNWCVEFSNRVHELEKTGVRISKANPLDDDVTCLVDYGGFVKTFGNIYSNNIHLQHPFGRSDFCGSKPVQR